MTYIGEISALSAAILWAFTSIVFTSASEKIGVIQLSLTRLILASILLYTTIILFGYDFNINLKQIILLSLSGIIGLIIGDTFLFKAFGMIGPRITMLIYSFNPAISALLAFLLFGEKLGWFSLIGIALTLTGISFVVSEKRTNYHHRFKISRLGLIWAALGAIGQAVGLICAKGAFLEGDINGLVATFMRIASATVIFLPIAIIMGKFKNPVKKIISDKPLLKLILIGTVIGPYLGIAASIYSIMYAKVGIASTLMSTTPIILIPLSIIFYKEKISMRSIIGTIIAVSGISFLFFT